MRKMTSRTIAASAVASVALLMTQTPVWAAGNITNFKVKNCTSKSIVICSFDKTDSLMKIPYQLKAIKPGDKKGSGCASLGKCKLFIVALETEKTKSQCSKVLKNKKDVVTARDGKTYTVFWEREGDYGGAYVTKKGNSCSAG